MIQKKICMLGSFAVGKTSLVKRFVDSLFSEKYQTTVGVKVDKKVISVDGEQVMLMLWDLEGEDDFNKIRLTYLRGASGYLLVADGTRSRTFVEALNIQEKVSGTFGELPFMLLINKEDLSDTWELKEAEIDLCRQMGWTVLRTSAKSGQEVESGFLGLARKMLENA